MRHVPRLASVLSACVALAFSGYGYTHETRYNGSRFFGAPGDWISLRMEGFTTAELPTFYAGGGKRKLYVKHELPRIAGIGGHTHPFELNGELTVRMSAWDGSGMRVVGRRQLVRWTSGQEQSFEIDFAGIRPGAYVVTAELPPDILAVHAFNPTNTASGMRGRQMVYGRNAMRLAVFEKVRPQDMFGVGNALMLHLGQGRLQTGHDLANALEARDLKPKSLRGTDPWWNALIGAPGCEMTIVDAGGADTTPEMLNPVSKTLDVFSPAGHAHFLRRAENYGRRFAGNLGVYSMVIAGEATMLGRGMPFASVWADRSFREYARTEFKGDLAAANGKWNRSFPSWEAVVQPIYVDGGTNAVVKTGAAAIDWYAGMGRLSTNLVGYLKQPENIEIAMSWYRWRVKTTVEAYVEFCQHAKRFDKKTLYLNCYCWPNFFTYHTFPVWRRTDAVGLDFQYLCEGAHGVFKRTSGANDEMLDIAEMAESVARGKPVFGYEIYVQPDYPGEFAALQNWAMIAHGVQNFQVFGWKPYSDHGDKVFRNGPKAWTRPADARAMWMLIDTDGTRLPVYYGVRRSAEEIAAFHAKYNGLSLRRIHGRTAIYLSTESSIYAMIVTGGHPYLSRELMTYRKRHAQGLRIGGARIEYLDDETLGELNRRDYDAVVVPPAPRMTEACERLLANFERAGGKVIRVGDWDPDFFALHPEVTRSAYWEGIDAKMETEVVVKRQEGTDRRFVFVLNRKAAGTGRLKGADFKGVTELTDALTGEKSGLTFPLGEYGYRVFEMAAPSRKE